jgi:hypothetical protein
MTQVNNNEAEILQQVLNAEEASRSLWLIILVLYQFRCCLELRTASDGAVCFPFHYIQRHLSGFIRFLLVPCKTSEHNIMTTSPVRASVCDTSSIYTESKSATRCDNQSKAIFSLYF